MNSKDEVQQINDTSRNYINTGAQIDQLEKI